MMTSIKPSQAAVCEHIETGAQRQNRFVCVSMQPPKAVALASRITK